MSEAIIEKDYWVCMILKYLFEDFKYKDYIFFKGGTSLSKVYNCIERFSEDIDLALDWDAIEISSDQAYENRSNRQQEIFNKNANEKTGEYLRNVWLPILNNDFKNIIDKDFDVYIDEYDPQTICFKYPNLFNDPAILQILRLEVGALAEPIPSSLRLLNSYISDAYPKFFDDSKIEVHSVDVSRTFFEKITILHREACRINGNFPLRYSRHYYDVYQLIEQGYAHKSLGSLDILVMVVEFKKKFYSCNWAKYDDVLDGKCRLVPSEGALEVFKNDYLAMKNMIYGFYPLFDEIIETISCFEDKLNSVIKAEMIRE